jgi:hypothetical protein
MIERWGRTRNGGGKSESPAIKRESFCYNYDLAASAAPKPPQLLVP